jgi:hypothetical protein
LLLPIFAFYLFTKSKATTSGSGFGYPTKGKSGKQTKIYQAQELKS